MKRDLSIEFCGKRMINPFTIAASPPSDSRERVERAGKPADTSGLTSLGDILKNAGVTTVVCGCDPLFMTFLTAKAKEQNYQPEWVVTGVALIDNDLIGVSELLQATLADTELVGIPQVRTCF